MSAGRYIRGTRKQRAYGDGSGYSTKFGGGTESGPSNELRVSGMPGGEIPLTNIQSTQPAANILPPPDDLTLPFVKLLTHPTYRSYQSHTASLSLFANLYVNFLPPAWGAPTPPTPAPPAVSEEGKEAEAEKAARADNKEKNERKQNSNS